MGYKSFRAIIASLLLLFILSAAAAQDAKKLDYEVDSVSPTDLSKDGGEISLEVSFNEDDKWDGDLDGYLIIKNEGTKVSINSEISTNEGYSGDVKFPVKESQLRDLDGGSYTLQSVMWVEDFSSEEDPGVVNDGNNELVRSQEFNGDIAEIEITSQGDASEDEEPAEDDSSGSTSGSNDDSDQGNEDSSNDFITGVWDGAQEGFMATTSPVSGAAGETAEITEGDYLEANVESGDGEEEGEKVSYPPCNDGDRDFDLNVGKTTRKSFPVKMKGCIKKKDGEPKANKLQITTQYSYSGSGSGRSTEYLVMRMSPSCLTSECSEPGYSYSKASENKRVVKFDLELTEHERYRYSYDEEIDYETDIFKVYALALEGVSGDARGNAGPHQGLKEGDPIVRSRKGLSYVCTGQPSSEDHAKDTSNSIKALDPDDYTCLNEGSDDVYDAFMDFEFKFRTTRPNVAASKTVTLGVKSDQDSEALLPKSCSSYRANNQHLDDINVIEFQKGPSLSYLVGSGARTTARPIRQGQEITTNDDIKIEVQEATEMEATLKITCPNREASGGIWKQYCSQKVGWSPELERDEMRSKFEECMASCRGGENADKQVLGESTTCKDVVKSTCDPVGLKYISPEESDREKVNICVEQ